MVSNRLEFLGNVVSAEQLMMNPDLRVVLYPGPHDINGVEWFELPHVIIDEERYWGIGFSSAAQDFLTGLEGLDISTGCAYSYNNFTDLVFSSNHNNKLTRFYTASSYDRIDFIATDRFKLIWEYGVTGSVGLLREAVKKGCALRVLFQDHLGMWNIHPVHMPIIHLEDDTFKLHTPKDAYPGIMRDSNEMHRFSEYLSSMAHTNEEFASGATKYVHAVANNVGYWSTFYEFAQDGNYKHSPAPGNEIDLQYKSLKIFSESIPA